MRLASVDPAHAAAAAAPGWSEVLGDASLDYLRPHYTQQQPVAAYPPINHRLEVLPARYLTEVPEKLLGYLPQVGATLTAAFAARAVTASDFSLDLDETLHRGTSVLMAALESI